MHEPVPVDADKVKPMEALIYSNQVGSVGEALTAEVILIFTKVF